MTPAQRKASALAIATALAIPAEGIRLSWYVDPPGILTVCYGHTGGVDKTKRYTLDECKALLNKDMLHAIEAVERCQPGLPTGVLAAFSDAVYNMGPRIACDASNSTAARLLKAGYVREACKQLPRWSKGKIAGAMITLPGLVKRRNREMEICLKDAT